MFYKLRRLAIGLWVKLEAVSSNIVSLTLINYRNKDFTVYTAQSLHVLNTYSLHIFALPFLQKYIRKLSQSTVTSK